MADRRLEGFDLEDRDAKPVRRNECPHCGDRLYPEDETFRCDFETKRFDGAARPGVREAPASLVPILRPVEDPSPFGDYWRVPEPWADPKKDPAPYWTPDPAVKTKAVAEMAPRILPALAVPGRFERPIGRCPVVALIRPLFDERDDCRCTPCTLRRNPPLPPGRPRATCGKPSCVTAQDTKTTAVRRRRKRMAQVHEAVDALQRNSDAVKASPSTVREARRIVAARAERNNRCLAENLQNTSPACR
jgi:hypothetical protein